MIHADSHGMRYEITIGRLYSAASSVAVPLATSTTSHASRQSCDRPAVSATPAASSGCARSAASISGRSDGIGDRQHEDSTGSALFIRAIAATNIVPR